MKRQLLFLFFLCVLAGLYAQTFTVYTSVKPRKTYHASPDCPNLYGEPIKRVVTFSDKMSGSDRKLIRGYSACSRCNPTRLSRVLYTGGIRYDTAGNDEFEIVDGGITIRPLEMTTSSNVLLYDTKHFFSVSDASDKNLIGCPVVCKVIQVRKSNITGSEGHLTLRPLYIDNLGEKIKVYGDIHVRGLNRANVKFWLGFLPPMWFIPGTGAKIYPTDRFTIYLK